MSVMKGLLALLTLNFIPRSIDFGLLLLRAGLGCGMMRHGLEKWQKWGQFRGTFSDPLQIGHQNSLILAIFAEVICSGLLIIGFGTRFAALVLACTTGVAFFIGYKGAISKGAISTGEMSALYLLCYVTLLIAGPGRFSFDGSGGGEAKPH